MATRDGVVRCTWCGEAGSKEHPIISWREENWHNACVEEWWRENKEETEKMQTETTVVVPGTRCDANQKKG